MRINNNVMALNAHRQLGINQAGAAKSMEKLSSGFRINRAGDDAAGLAISEKMRGQIRGLKQASRNSQDAISLIQTAEGALNESHAILQRMRELAVQSATDTNVNVDRNEIQKEIDQLAEELTRISNTTEFNTQNLLGGGLGNTFHVGANEGQNVKLNIRAMDAESLGVAGYQVSAGAFDANGTNITGVDQLGRGLTEQNYSIVTTKEAAVVGTLNSTIGTDFIGSIAGNYTGDHDTNLQIRVTQTDSNKVEKWEYSLDGGDNWTNVDGEGGAIGSTGLTWTVGTGDYGDIQEGVVISTSVTAATFSAQLVDGSTNEIGKAVSFRHSATNVVVGDGATGETMKINFTAGSVATGTATQAVTTLGSEKAILNADGSIQVDAKAAAGLNVSNQAAADKAITIINDALEEVSAERSKLGAMQNRLEHTIANLGTSAENLQAAESRIRDLDMADEIMKFTKDNILQQAATAMLAQANMAPQSVLQLLG